MSYFRIIIFLKIAFIVATDGGDPFNEEMRLRDDLFVKQKVNNFSRPVQLGNETLVVHFHFLITHIAELNEKTETLTLNGWVAYGWQDMHFKWDPKQYGGIRHLPVNRAEIWTPDIYLLNNADASNINPVGDVSPIVTNWGRIWWIPPVTFRSICPLDLRTFPFDEHICRLMFISWHYWEEEVYIQMMAENETLTMFLANEHNEWEIVSSHGNRSEYIFPAYPDHPAYFVTYFVQLRRRAPYYRLALMVPSLVAMMTTLVIFWIPPTAGEKYVVGGFNVFTLTLLLTHLYWVVPRSGSAIPGIVLFCGNSMIFAGLSLIISIITSSICRKTPSVAPPNFIRNLLANGIISSVLCLQSGTRKVYYTGNAQLLTNEEDEEESAEPPAPSPVDEWVKVAVAIDRLCFFVYCFSFIIILSVAFG